MARIRIIGGGCGLIENGCCVLKTSADGYFEVGDAEAERLVGLGMASYEVEPERRVATAPEEENPAEEAGEPLLSEMTFKQLKEHACGMGINAGKYKNKADLIAAIEAEAGTEDEEDDDPGNLVV